MAIGEQGLGIRVLIFVSLLFFALGLRIGDAHRKEAAEPFDLTAIMAPGCAPASARVPPAAMADEDRPQLL